MELVEFLTRPYPNTWHIVCILSKSCSFVATYNTIPIGLIAAERFVLIKYPYAHARLVTIERILGVAFISGVFLFVWTTAVFVMNVEVQYGAVCDFHVILPFWVMTYFVIPLFVVIIGLTFFFYSSIACVAMKQRRAIAALVAQSLGTQKSSTNMKVTKMMLLVLGVYLACYLPMVFVIGTLTPHYSLRQDIIMFTAQFFWWIHAFANPFIYAWKDKSYRRAFAKLLAIK